MVRQLTLVFCALCAIVLLGGCQSPTHGAQTPPPALLHTSPAPITSPSSTGDRATPWLTASSSPLPPFTVTSQATRQTPSPLPDPWTLPIYMFSAWPTGSSYEAWQMGTAGVYVPTLSHKMNRAEPSLTDAPANSPALATFVAFAHHSDLVAYWIAGRPSQLWVADLAFAQPRLLYTDTAGTYDPDDPLQASDQVRLTWSPDDVYVWVDARTASLPDLLLDVHTAASQPWPWACEAVALSPRSNRLATWCRPVRGESDYVVMEWGGEIWQASGWPMATVVSTDRGKPATWAWSADGALLAYFDPDDPTWRLRITDATGRTVKTSLSLSDQGRHVDLASWSPADLQWATAGHRLLVRSYGTEARPCPPYRRELHPIPGEAPDLRVPCWHVVDASTGQIVWNTADLDRTQVFDRYPPDANDPAIWSVGSAAISPDGGQVLVNFYTTLHELAVVVDLTTGAATTIAPAWQVRWGHGQ